MKSKSTLKERLDHTRSCATEQLSRDVSVAIRDYRHAGTISDLIPTHYLTIADRAQKENNDNK